VADVRPLFQEEVVLARKLAREQWRPIWRIELVKVAVFGSLLFLIRPPVASWEGIVFLAVIVVFLFHSFLYVWLGYRYWRRQFDLDIKTGVEERTAKVFDRFWTPAMFTANKYVIWAEGISLSVNRKQYQEIQIGDALELRYLPQTGILLSYQKVTGSR